MSSPWLNNPLATGTPLPLGDYSGFDVEKTGVGTMVSYKR